MVQILSVTILLFDSLSISTVECKVSTSGRHIYIHCFPHSLPNDRHNLKNHTIYSTEERIREQHLSKPVTALLTRFPDTLMMQNPFSLQEGFLKTNFCLQTLTSLQ